MGYYVQDDTGVLPNLIPPQIIPSTNFLEALYVDDGNMNALLNLNNYSRYLYAYFQDTTNGNPITYVNARYFTFLDYITKPSAVTINKNFALQLVPASGSQHTVFYYISSSQNLTMQFTLVAVHLH